MSGGISTDIYIVKKIKALCTNEKEIYNKNTTKYTKEGSEC